MCRLLKRKNSVLVFWSMLVLAPHATDLLFGLANETTPADIALPDIAMKPLLTQYAEQGL